MTDSPMQKGFDEAAMETLTGKFGLTIIVTGLLIAGLPVVQVSEEVSVQVITSLFKGIKE